MPVARLVDWRIIAGTVTSASLVASTVVENFALQSDQGFETPWAINAFKSLVVTVQRTWIAADQTKHSDGGVRAMWHFDYMTNQMINYWMTQFMSGVSFITGIQSAPVTIKTYSKLDAVIYLNATMYTPSGTPQVGGWQDVEWFFENGVVTS